MAAAFLVVLSACTSAPEVAPVDVILVGGDVYRGPDQPLRRTDIAVRGDRIVAVGDSSNWVSARRFDVTGLIVAPGFVDLHSHAIRLDVRRSGLLQWPGAENLVRQGVTTVIGGPDGTSPLPVARTLERVARVKPAVNYGTFVGQGSIRREVIGAADRAASANELIAMRALVRRAAADGAFGLSSGLIYPPGRFASTAEIAEIAGELSPSNGIYISHIRNESDKLLDSIDEALEIGRLAGVPVQITHIKAMGVANWGRADRVLKKLEQARGEGLDVTADVYPYAASSTGLTAMFPGWSLAGDMAERQRMLADPTLRRRVIEHVATVMRTQRTGDDPARVQLAFCRFDTGLNGQNLAEVLSALGRTVTVDNAAKLVVDLQSQGGCTAVYHAMSERDVADFIADPRTMVASDGGVIVPGHEMPHPRNYGAFARVIAEYVNGRRLLTLPEAIYKLAEFPAARIGLADRGKLGIGCVADIVAFDPQAFRDRATFTQPNQFATGMSLVMVAGDTVLEDGTLTDARPGRIVRSTDTVTWDCH